jgi:hypothetical protein
LEDSGLEFDPCLSGEFPIIGELGFRLDEAGSGADGAVGAQRQQKLSIADSGVAVDNGNLDLFYRAFPRHVFGVDDEP